MTRILSLVIAVIAIYWVWNNIISPPKWIGFYYPDAGNLYSYKQSDEFGSLTECREWVDDISGGRTDTGFDYECGKNCKLSQTGGIYICDETVD